MSEDSHDVPEPLHRLGELFDVLSNSVRLEILFFLEDNSAFVQEIADELDRPKQAISRHLKVLRYGDLVDSQTEGRKRYYRIKRPELLELCHKFEQQLKRD